MPIQNLGTNAYDSSIHNSHSWKHPREDTVAHSGHGCQSSTKVSSVQRGEVCLAHSPGDSTGPCFGPMVVLCIGMREWETLVPVRPVVQDRKGLSEVPTPQGPLMTQEPPLLKDSPTSQQCLQHKGLGTAEVPV